MIKKKLFFCFSFFVSFACSAVAWGQQGAWVQAIERDSASAVMQELAQGMDPNERDAELEPALMLAIRHQSWKAYDTLLANRHIEVNVENGRQETPMMYLALLGQTKRLQELQKRGGQINRLGWTPLHYAASKGHTDTVRYLLSQQALVNAPAPDGTSPLMMAALAGGRELVDLLLQAGADVRMRNAQQLNAADWAISAGHEGLAAYLQQVQQNPGRLTRPATPKQKSVRDVDSQAPLSTPANPPATGGSRYFDLERFDQPASP